MPSATSTTPITMVTHGARSLHLVEGAAEDHAEQPEHGDEAGGEHRRHRDRPTDALMRAVRSSMPTNAER